MSDVLLFQTNDGGDVEFVGGQPTMHDGFDVAVYLSCWGGNEEDPGLLGDTSKTWWGNLDEPTDRQYRSELQYLLRDLPVMSSNRQRVEDAADRDLHWMRAALSATVSVTVSIPARNTWLIEIAVVVGSETYKSAFERKGPNA